MLALVSPARVLGARPVSFNLSTNRSFAPTDKPTIHLYAQNVDELEFRILSGAGPGQISFRPPPTCTASITERPLPAKSASTKELAGAIPRLEASSLVFSSAVSSAASSRWKNRDRLRARQASLARRSRIVGVAEFAQIPLLNDRQLVARWRQELPPTYISDSQELPIDPLPSGLYLIEATDGHFKAYTLLMVSRMAMVTRTAGGSVLAYCVDRVAGAGIAGVQVSAGLGSSSKPVAKRMPTDLPTCT